VHKSLRYVYTWIRIRLCWMNNVADMYLFASPISFLVRQRHSYTVRIVCQNSYIQLWNTQVTSCDKYKRDAVCINCFRKIFNTCVLDLTFLLHLCPFCNRRIINVRWWWWWWWWWWWCNRSIRLYLRLYLSIEGNRSKHCVTFIKLVVFYCYF